MRELQEHLAALLAGQEDRPMPFDCALCAALDEHGLLTLHPGTAQTWDIVPDALERLGKSDGPVVSAARGIGDGSEPPVRDLRPSQLAPRAPQPCAALPEPEETT